ncbi:hypothetical protein SAMN02744133_10890 [Thalassospira xiamenensis M-5 = DSM 17429]|uniref:Beta-lactamase n=1 Tax=Thalassospira xiamenensis M-5 = DSM 17429 TaxID=1123366 RepID=A0AB72UJW8_9PROT|nr:hypothetical protein [Thalassospira xiamenensis]AJD54365.1 hypothetical protein TH3_21463 [Thalassospira xiamenensis M-5 = DSM 17429]SIT21592.1 hypothetical protein SAMN02744133_10890 [Thalassospira xiamenensis M-5 = DSM 17429]
MTELSKQQEKWCEELRAHINKMPTGIEICVLYGGVICVAEHGALKEYSDRVGDCDYRDVQWLTTIFPKKSVARRIDGRDTQV